MNVVQSLRHCRAQSTAWPKPGKAWRARRARKGKGGAGGASAERVAWHRSFQACSGQLVASEGSSREERSVAEDKLVAPSLRRGYHQLFAYSDQRWPGRAPGWCLTAWSASQPSTVSVSVSSPRPHILSARRIPVRSRARSTRPASAVSTTDTSSSRSTSLTTPSASPDPFELGRVKEEEDCAALFMRPRRRRTRTSSRNCRSLRRRTAARRGDGASASSCGSEGVSC